MENETISYGLAGEDEYVELGEEVSAEECVVTVSTPTVINDTSVSDVTKSGRVRKKTAKFIEMEQEDMVEKKVTKYITKGKKRDERARLSISDQVSADASFEIPELVINERPIKMKLQLASAEGLEPLHGRLKVSKKGAEVLCTDRDYTPPKSPCKKKAKYSIQSLTAELTSLSPAPVLQHARTVPQTTAAGLQMNSDFDLGRHTKKQSKKLRQKGYTAYMLWCAAQRNSIISRNPGMDFSTLSKRLGDIWQTISHGERLIWKRKARKLAKKGSLLISTGHDRNPTRGRPRGSTASEHRAQKYKQMLESPSHGHYKVTGTGHIDVSAHLKLLGESLTTIGARLQEHKGQIAVQGSLSVLLDSLLCSLGPLMCLTNMVPELNGCEEHIHARTLDNIAYIMPGVG